MQDQQNDILFEKFKIISCIKKDQHTGIYIADHIYLGKKIFLKTLNKANLSNPAILDRFQREARLLARLDHPNIIKVYDFGTMQNWFYISFEYFPSSDLRKTLRKDQLSINEKENIFIGIVQGLDAAHKLNIIHRDIKPENVLIGENGSVKIADFGLALIKDEPHTTQQESIVGTPGYMSPEQIRGESLTHSSDLFSLGILAYELFNGENPFLGKDAGETLNNILGKSFIPEFKNPDNISQNLLDIITRLLNKNPKTRPASANEILLNLDVKPIATQPAQKKSALSKVSKGYRLVILIFVLVSLTVIIFLWQSTDKTTTEPVTTDAPENIPQSVLQDTLQQVDLVTDKTEPDQQPIVISNNEQKPESPAPTGPGRLDIQCSPWAQVWIDSSYIDTTPLEDDITLLPGEHVMVLKHPDYPEYTLKLNIEPYIKQTISLNLDTLCGYFDCKLYPWGEIFINNAYIGQTPLPGLIRLLPGEHTLEVKNRNYSTIKEMIYIAKKETLVYQLNFERIVTGN